MKVAVFGGREFPGKHIVGALVEAEHDVKIDPESEEGFDHVVRIGDGEIRVDGAVLRTGPIFGTGDSFVSRIAWWTHFSQVVPAGFREPVRPVAAEDVARAVVGALGKEGEYELVGPEVLSPGEVVHRVGRAMNLKVAARGESEPVQVPENDIDFDPAPFTPEAIRPVAAGAKAPPMDLRFL